MNTLALIQARVGSTRLPNKVLKNICGKPVLQWVAERVRRSRSVDEVAVVTSIEKGNLPLIRLCAELGIRVFAGSEEDVLDRYYQAARLLRPEYVVRVTADCPFFDWRYLDMAVIDLESGTDYLWMGEDVFPDGLDLEIIRFAALKKAWKEARFASEREHVTVYIRNHPELFAIQVFSFPIKGIGHYRWTLDEEADFMMISKVYEHFVSAVHKEDFVTEDIVSFLEAHSEIAELNAGIGRNEGLIKSMANDRVLKDGEVF